MNRTFVSTNVGCSGRDCLCLRQEEGVIEKKIEPVQIFLMPALTTSASSRSGAGPAAMASQDRKEVVIHIGNYVYMGNCYLHRNYYLPGSCGTRPDRSRLLPVTIALRRSTAVIFTCPVRTHTRVYKYGKKRLLYNILLRHYTWLAPMRRLLP
jgi:hypothetical protein